MHPLSHNAPHYFYDITELLTMLVTLCPWRTIINLSNVDKRTRCIIRNVIHQRVRFFLGLFIPSEHIGSLIAMIQTSRGAIVGGIVRCIMSLDMPIFFRTNPLQLSILLPTVEARSPWADFLLSIGYTLKRSGRCSYMFAMSCRYNELYESVSDSCIHVFCYLFLLCSVWTRENGVRHTFSSPHDSSCTSHIGNHIPMFHDDRRKTVLFIPSTIRRQRVQAYPLYGALPPLQTNCSFCGWVIKPKKLSHSTL